jgi:hypothetical protein
MDLPLGRSTIRVAPPHLPPPAKDTLKSIQE